MQTYKIHVLCFCARAKNITQDKTPELCSQKLQANPKPLQIACEEGLRLPLKNAYQVFKICLEVRHIYYLIREYPGIRQIRQWHISCKRKQFINLTIFLNCFHNFSDLLTLIVVRFDLLSKEQDYSRINVYVVLCICLMFSTCIVFSKYYC